MLLVRPVSSRNRQKAKPNSFLCSEKKIELKAWFWWIYWEWFVEAKWLYYLYIFWQWFGLVLILSKMTGCMHSMDSWGGESRTNKKVSCIWVEYFAFCLAILLFINCCFVCVSDGIVVVLITKHLLTSSSSTKDMLKLTRRKTNMYMGKSFIFESVFFHYSFRNLIVLFTINKQASHFGWQHLHWSSELQLWSLWGRVAFCANNHYITVSVNIGSSANRPF